MRINVPSTSTMMDTSRAWFVYAGKIKVQYFLNRPRINTIQKFIKLAVTSGADNREIIHLTCPSPFPVFPIKTVNCYTFGDPSLLRCYIMSNSKQLPSFQRIIVPSSSSSARNLILVLDLLDPEEEVAIILQKFINTNVSVNNTTLYFIYNKPSKVWLTVRQSMV